MVLGRRLPGRVGRRRISHETGPFGAPFSRSLRCGMPAAHARSTLRWVDRAGRRRPAGAVPASGVAAGSLGRVGRPVAAAVRPGRVPAHPAADHPARARRARGWTPLGTRVGLVQLALGLPIRLGPRRSSSRAAPSSFGRLAETAAPPTRVPAVRPPWRCAPPVAGAPGRVPSRRSAGRDSTTSAHETVAEHGRWPATRGGVAWPAVPPGSPGRGWRRRVRPPGGGRWTAARGRSRVGVDDPRHMDEWIRVDEVRDEAASAGGSGSPAPIVTSDHGAARRAGARVGGSGRAVPGGGEPTGRRASSSGWRDAARAFRRRALHRRRPHPGQARVDEAPGVAAARELYGLTLYRQGKWRAAVQASSRPSGCSRGRPSSIRCWPTATGRWATGPWWPSCGTSCARPRPAPSSSSRAASSWPA